MVSRVLAALALLVAAVLCLGGGEGAKAQLNAYQCRTAPIGGANVIPKTSACASEAMVSNHFPNGATSGHVAIFSDSSGQIIADGGAFFAPGVVNDVTGDYTVAIPDCGGIIAASGGQHALTLPSAAGFPAHCVITVVNKEVYSGIGTGRGKVMVGWPADWYGILYPRQGGQIFNDNGTWVSISAPQRWKIPQAAELCVREDGNDGHDGLGDGSSAADCLAHIQAAVVTIGLEWDGGGYNSCAIGLYSGGTSTFNESVSATGQSIGCYLTFNFRAPVTWMAPLSCFSGGDNGIAIFNINLGPVPIFQCNTSNTPAQAVFYCHQTCIYDVFGSFEWIPDGGNDALAFLDGQGRVTFAFSIPPGSSATSALIVGDANPFGRAFNDMFHCDEHCSQLQVSGPIGISPHVHGNQIFTAMGGSLINASASWAGAFDSMPLGAYASGNSVINLNGSTLPATVQYSNPTGGQVCGTVANPGKC